MRTVLKITAGILLAGIVCAGGRAALIGASAEQAGKDIPAVQEVEAKTSAKAKAEQTRTVGTAHAVGDFAVAEVNGRVADPDGPIELTVTSTPHQVVSVNWTMTCSKGLGGAGSKSGDYKVTTPSTRIMLKPAENVTDCIVGGSAQLDTGGTVRLKITGLIEIDTVRVRPPYGH
jgi:hypothetical protein